MARLGSVHEEPVRPVPDDEHARSVGTAVCFALLEHRVRIADAVERLVEPQVEALLDELSQTLDVPGTP